MSAADQRRLEASCVMSSPLIANLRACDAKTVKQCMAVMFWVCTCLHVKWQIWRKKLCKSSLIEHKLPWNPREYMAFSGSHFQKYLIEVSRIKRTPDSEKVWSSLQGHVNGPPVVKQSVNTMLYRMCITVCGSLYVGHCMWVIVCGSLYMGHCLIQCMQCWDILVDDVRKNNFIAKAVA